MLSGLTMVGTQVLAALLGGVLGGLLGSAVMLMVSLIWKN